MYKLEVCAKKRMEFYILYAKKFFDNMKFATTCLEHTDTCSENNHIQSGQIIKYASFEIIAVKLSNKNQMSIMEVL